MKKKRRGWVLLNFAYLYKYKQIQTRSCWLHGCSMCWEPKRLELYVIQVAQTHFGSEQIRKHEKCTQNPFLYFWKGRGCRSTDIQENLVLKKFTSFGTENVMHTWYCIEINLLMKQQNVCSLSLCCYEWLYPPWLDLPVHSFVESSLELKKFSNSTYLWFGSIGLRTVPHKAALQICYALFFVYVKLSICCRIFFFFTFFVNSSKRKRKNEY